MPAASTPKRAGHDHGRAPAPGPPARGSATARRTGGGAHRHLNRRLLGPRQQPGRRADGAQEGIWYVIHQIGALAAAIHRSAAPLPAEEGVPALAKVERRLQAARPNLQPGDKEFIRQLVARAEDVSPLDRVPTHADFQLLE